MTNALTAYQVNKISYAMKILHENLCTARLVNRNVDNEFGYQYKVIQFPYVADVTTASITPASIPAAAGNLSTGTVTMSLAYWKEVSHVLSDKEQMEIQNGTSGGAVDQWVKKAAIAIAKDIDTSLLSQYKYIYGYVGDSTPFSTIAYVTSAKQILNTQLCPIEGRVAIIDEVAEAQALQLAQFTDADKRGNADPLIRGSLGRTLGFDWFMNQNVQSHTAGSPGGTPVTKGSTAVGATAIVVDGVSAAGTYKAGDVVTFAGHTQTYVLATALSAASAGSALTFSITPALATGVADGVAVSLKASHTANLAFTPDAFVLAMRPTMPGVLASHPTSYITDPVTGLALRMTMSQEHYRTRVAISALWGVKCLEPKCAVRLADT